jgi:hypothetical protein
MVIAMHTKDEEQKGKALAALAQYFKHDTPLTLDAVYSALNSVSEKRRPVCMALVDFVTVKMTAPGTMLDGLSIIKAYENVQFKYCMYILPFNFTATRPVDELHSIYRDIVMVYFDIYPSDHAHREVFFHIHKVLDTIKMKGGGDDSKVSELLESVNEICERWSMPTN